MILMRAVGEAVLGLVHAQLRRQAAATSAPPLHFGSMMPSGRAGDDRREIVVGQAGREIVDADIDLRPRPWRGALR